MPTQITGTTGVDKISSIAVTTAGLDRVSATNNPAYDSTNDTRPVTPAWVRGVTNLASSSGASRVGFTQLGVGAVDRTVENKLRESISVKDFGAVGDGIADDTNAIQAAINYVVRGLVRIPAGNYKTSSIINIPEGVYVQGDGVEVTNIFPTGNFTAFNIGGSISAIHNTGGLKDLTIMHAGKTLTNAIGVKSEWANNTEITNVRVRRSYIGFYFSNVWQVKYNNCVCDGAGTEQNYIGTYMAECHPTNQNNAILATGCVMQGVEYVGWRLINFNGSKFTACEGMNGVHGWYLGAPTTGTEMIRWGHFTNCLGDTCSGDIWKIENSSSVATKQLHFSNIWAGNSLGGHGFAMYGVSRVFVSGLLTASTNKSGVYLFQSSRNSISTLVVDDYDDAATGNGAVVFEGLLFNTLVGLNPFGGDTSKAFVEMGSSDSNVVSGSQLDAGFTLVGTNSRADAQAGNIGGQKSSGSAIIASGTTSVVVNHSLHYTPTINEIRLQSRDGMGEAKNYFVSNVTASQFTINSNVDPNVNVLIAWHIK